MLDFESIGNQIREMRVKHGYSQDCLAELLGVSHQAVSRWENGLTAPTVDNIAELCSLFDISFEQLLCLNNEIKLDEKDIFKGHSRMFVVKQIADGNCKLNLAEKFDLFFPQERMILLRALKEGKISADNTLLLSKLSPQEYKFLKNKKK